MTSALYESIARIARHEANGRAVAGIGRVTEIFEGSQQDHAVTVAMRDTGLVLPNVPVAVGVMGYAAIPAVDELVVVAFMDGDFNAPVVVGRLYHPDQAPPMHKDGQIVLHVPSSDPQIKLDVESKTPKINLAMGDVQVEILEDTLTVTVGDATIRALSSGGRIDIEVGDASIVMKKNGDIALKGKDIKLQGSGNVEIAASAKLKLSGAQVEVN